MLEDPHDNRIRHRARREARKRSDDEIQLTRSGEPDHDVRRKEQGRPRKNDETAHTQEQSQLVGWKPVEPNFAGVWFGHRFTFRLTGRQISNRPV
jgi:hypothetical protein